MFQDVVIGCPSQNVTLSCSLASESTNEATIGWSVGHVGPHGVSTIQNGIMSGYSASLKGELIIRNVMTNDNRNQTEYQCWIMQNRTIRGNPIALYVAGE